MVNTTIHKNALRKLARGGLPLSGPPAMPNAEQPLGLGSAWRSNPALQ